jgi:hypothetical protein
VPSYSPLKLLVPSVTIIYIALAAREDAVGGNEMNGAAIFRIARRHAAAHIAILHQFRLYHAIFFRFVVAVIHYWNHPVCNM